jgi:hypothetical protein
MSPQLSKVDEFEKSYQRAANYAAVLKAVMTGQATGEFGAEDENRLWWGLHEITNEIARDLEVLREQEAKLSDHVYNLENGQGPVKGEGREARRSNRKGGAR